MNTYISILRGINVGGHNTIKMDDLKQLYLNLGLKRVQSYIQSGNLIFQSEKGKDDIQNLMEEAILKKLNLSLKVIVRTDNEWETIIRNNPFSNLAEQNQLYVTFLSAIPLESKLDDLLKKDISPDVYFVSEKTIYLKCHTTYRNTKLTNNLIEKALQVSATTRNWNTVLRMQEMVIQQRTN